MAARKHLSEWQIVIMVVLVTIILVRATAPTRLAHSGCKPASISAKCRIAPR